MYRPLSLNRTSSFRRIGWFVIIIALSFNFQSISYGLTCENQSPAQEEFPPSVLERWGVQVEAVSLAAADHALLFRYRVVDPDKAASLMRRDKKAFLLHQATGKSVPVFFSGKVGQMRQTGTKPQANKVYTIMFSNPGKMVERGDRITVVIGDFEVKDLAVR